MARAPGQPACGNEESHSYHNHTWMDMHFKEHSVWCEGVCLCQCSCSEHRGQPHGPGAHK